jgi:hypothetical protein
MNICAINSKATEKKKKKKKGSGLKSKNVKRVIPSQSGARQLEVASSHFPPSAPHFQRLTLFLSLKHQ